MWNVQIENWSKKIYKIINKKRNNNNYDKKINNINDVIKSIQENPSNNNSNIVID